MKSYSVTILMKASEQYFPACGAVYFSLVYKVKVGNFSCFDLMATS